MISLMNFLARINYDFLNDFSPSISLIHFANDFIHDLSS